MCSASTSGLDTETSYKHQSKIYNPLQINKEKTFWKDWKWIVVIQNSALWHLDSDDQSPDADEDETVQYNTDSKSYFDW